jgi:hypothetical protein
MSTSTPPTTIQITRTNLGLLDDVGAIMQERFPHLWGDQKPSRNTIVGYLAGEFLSGDASSPRTLPATSVRQQPLQGPLPAVVERPAPVTDGERQVYALRSSDGRFRGKWHVPSYHECPGRAAFEVQHPNDDYSLVNLEEVVRRRLKQCAFCYRYEQGDV